jgi:hypothetical protein
MDQQLLIIPKFPENSIKMPVSPMYLRISDIEKQSLVLQHCHLMWFHSLREDKLGHGSVRTEITSEDAYLDHQTDVSLH